MVPQYVFPTNRGLFRIVRHGRRWRALIDADEVARHDSAEAAVAALRQDWPQARLPERLIEWRYIAEESTMPHARLARATSTLRVAGFDPSQARVQRSRRPTGKPARGAADHG